MTDDGPMNGWHLDKRVPITLIAAICVQTVGIVWWASAINERVAKLEETALSNSDQVGRIIRNETRIDIITTGMSRIESKLDRLIERTEP